MSINPLIILKARHASISGGYYRLYEILKNGKPEGINYVIVTDLSSYQNYVQMFPDFREVLEYYKTYCVNFQKIKFYTDMHRLKAATGYLDSFLSAVSISKIAREEKVDLIIGPSEGTWMVWTSYFSSILSQIPWTALFQGDLSLFEPTPGLGPINPFNALKHVSRKEFFSKAPLKSRLGFSIELQGLLKIAEKSLILTVGRYLYEQIKYLDPRISFHIISPGNGVDLKRFSKKLRHPSLYDGVFFSRLIPEKGIFELPVIWKKVVQRFPKARLAVAGSVEDQKFVEIFQRMIYQYGLSENVVYLGPQNKDSIIDLVASSKVAIYPSFRDVFSLVVLESLACGTPVVAYDIPGLRYSFPASKAILQCPIGNRTSMANAIILLLENEELRTKLSKEAKKYADNFDWKKVVRAEKEAYFKVIEWFNSR